MDQSFQQYFDHIEEAILKLVEAKDALKAVCPERGGPVTDQFVKATSAASTQLDALMEAFDLLTDAIISMDEGEEDIDEDEDLGEPDTI